MKHFKTEGKKSFFFSWKTFKCVPVWKKAKRQNPKILCKTQQPLSAIAVQLPRITFPQPA